MYLLDLQNNGCQPQFHILCITLKTLKHVQNQVLIKFRSEFSGEVCATQIADMSGAASPFQRTQLDSHCH